MHVHSKIKWLQTLQGLILQELTDLENEGYHIGEDGELTHKDDLEKEVKRRERRERRKKERELEIAKRKQLRKAKEKRKENERRNEKSSERKHRWKRER